MSPNAFIGNAESPTEIELRESLGDTKAAWDQLIGDLAEKYGVGIQEWKCYSRKAGWSLRLKRGKRTIAWMAPCVGDFRVMFILGGKAVEAARQSGLPVRVLRIIDEAEKYPEGIGIRLKIRSPKDLPTVMKLAAIKLAN